MRIIAYDTETPLMRAAYQAPPAVCGQWCDVHPGGKVGAGNVALPEQFLPELVGWLADPACLLVGAETAFDVLVPCTTVDLTHKHMARDLGLDPECPGTDLLERFVSAIDADRVTDIFIRQKQLDLARGCYRYERNADGTITGVNKYNLADLARRIGNVDMPGESKRCSVCKNTGCPSCPWRLRYVELRGIPVNQWPREAYEYAALDPVATALVWVNQWRPSTKIEANFPGVPVSDVLANEFEEFRSALPLKAIAAYGCRTDPGAVAAFEANVREQHEAVVGALIKAGLVERQHKRDREALKDFIRREGLERHFMSIGPGDLPTWSFAKACFQNACQDPTVDVATTGIALARWHAGDLTDPDLLERGLVAVHDKKNTKAAHALVTWAHTSTGAPCVPEALMTDGGESGKPVPKTDKDSLGIAAELVESAIATGRYGDPNGVLAEQAQQAADALRDYAELGHLAKQISTDIPILKHGAQVPIHTRFEVQLETERTSSSGPNIQNQARGGKIKCRACKGKGKLPSGGVWIDCAKCDGEGSRDLPGTRECFVPRAGWVLIDTDYSMLEIYALAQTCLWELGFSGMAEALRAGRDVHMVVAAQILGKTYEWCKEHAKDPEVKNARNAAKAVNFGRPGGLSAKTMRSYAVKSYGVNLPVDAPPENPDAPNWTGIIRTWNETWSEMPAYFAFVNRQESYPKSGMYNIRYPSPKTGARGGIDGFRALATYCAACNTKYQRLGARTAKRAAWYLFKACYTRNAEGSAELFGCRPVNFIHDQFLTEAPEHRAEAAAWAVTALMNKAGRELCPDVPPTTEPVLCRRWSKNAEERREPCLTCGAEASAKCKKDCTTGTRARALVPWEDVRLEGAA